MERLRRVIQLGGAALSNGYLSALSSGKLYGGPLKGICVPFLSCFACPTATFSCPIGSLQHFATTRTLPLMLIGGIGLVGLTVGRMACGWLCPFGLLQDLMHKLPTRKIAIPRALSRLKYAVLALLVIAIPFLTGDPWFSKLCPMGTLTAGLPWVTINPGDVIAPDDVGGLFLLKLLILGAFLGLFVIARRPFCRSVCPMGAILGLFNRVSLTRLEVSSKCSGCGRCQARCPVEIKVCEEPDSPECVRCLSCTSCANVRLRPRFAGREPVSASGRIRSIEN